MTIAPGSQPLTRLAGLNAGITPILAAKLDGNWMLTAFEAVSGKSKKALVFKSFALCSLKPA